jgi:PAS domain S-box-containing protein
MLDHIHQSYTQRLTLATLARKLERQSAYLGRLFREEIGVTVHEYITRARMIFGAAEVRSGVKIEAIALDLGYRSKKNFYRQFKRRFGMTPEAYRWDRREHADDSSVVRPPRRGHNGEVTASPVSIVVAEGQDQGTGGPHVNRVGRLRSFARQMVERKPFDSHVAMLVTDDKGRYVGANQTAVSITGYSVDELRGMSAEALFPRRCDLDIRCRLQILLRASSSLPCNAVLRTKAMRAIQVHLTSVENVL